MGKVFLRVITIKTWMLWEFLEGNTDALKRVHIIKETMLEVLKHIKTLRLEGG